MRTFRTTMAMAICLASAVAVSMAAAPVPGTTAVTFSANPATLSGNTDVDVTIFTGTTSGAGQPAIDEGKVTIHIATDGTLLNADLEPIGGNPVPAAQAVFWMPLNDPGQNPASGATSYGVDLDALGCVPGTFVGFSAHYVTGGGTAKVATHWSAPVDLEIASSYEGLSHGYWKNHVEDWTDFDPSDTLGDIFSSANSYGLGSYTLYEALSFGGGNTLEEAARILLRNAVASLLNAAHPSINYPLTLTQVVTNVNAALDTADRDTILELEELLDGYNNLSEDLE